MGAAGSVVAVEATTVAVVVPAVRETCRKAEWYFACCRCGCAVHMQLQACQAFAPCQCAALCHCKLCVDTEEATAKKVQCTLQPVCLLSASRCSPEHRPRLVIPELSSTTAVLLAAKTGPDRWMQTASQPAAGTQETVSCLCGCAHMQHMQDLLFKHVLLQQTP